VYGTTVDVGLGGLLLRTAAPFAPGSDVEVRLQLAGVSTPIVARGTVAWSNLGAPGARAGIGVQFEHIASGADALESLLGRVARAS